MIKIILIIACLMMFALAASMLYIMCVKLTDEDFERYGE